MQNLRKRKLTLQIFSSIKVNSKIMDGISPDKTPSWNYVNK
jgi:hypothetical protein